MRHLRKSCSKAEVSSLIFIEARTSLQLGSSGHCNGTILAINLFKVTEYVKTIQLADCIHYNNLFYNLLV